jgi:DNA polymerase-3 subunit delta'
MTRQDIRLEEFFSGRLKSLKGSGISAHSFLLEGPFPPANFLAARAFASFLLCENREEAPCGECLSCRKAAAGIHPDVQETGDGKKSIGVDEIRGIKEKIYFYPNEGQFRIILIHGAEEMTAQAQNALLIMLEEPPKFVKFILTAKDQKKLLPTIRSRVLSFPLHAAKEDETFSLLGAKYQKKDDGKVREALRICEGFAGGAEEILSGSFHDSLKTAAFGLMQRFTSCDQAEFYRFGESCFSDKNQAEELLSYLRILLRDVAVYKAFGEKAADFVYFCSEMLQIENISSKMTNRKIVNLMRLTDEAARNIALNGNFSLLSFAFLSGFWEENN